MTPGRFTLGGLILALALSTGPAVSQTPLDDPLDARDAKRVERMEKVVRELRAIVFQLRDTGRPVVVQPADTDARLDDLIRRLGDMEQTLRGLNGSLETGSRDLDDARRENAALKAQIQALTDRLASVEQKLIAPEPPAAPAPGDPTEGFAKARQLMQAGDFDAAEIAFAAFVEAYPDASRTPEARYWLGKTLSARAAHADAAQAFIGAIRGWPQTAWAPDAVAELAKALVGLRKPADACQVLTELPRRYPKASPAVAKRAAAVRVQAKCAA
jgi:tol-pal system protein YbgF